MGRLQRLQKEISKNLNNGQELGDIIENWTPNNLRRLLISPKTIIIEYYVTGDKTERLKATIDVEQDTKVDYAKVMNPNNVKYKSLLSALVNTKIGKSTRVFSSIEEIIFFGGYPEALLKRDVVLNELVEKNKLDAGEPLINLLQNRFVRLHSISVYNGVSETDMMALLDMCKPFGVTIADTLEGKGVGYDRRFTINGDKWWKGEFLRPKDYALDGEGTRLYKYFKKNIAELEKIKNKEELDTKYKKLKNTKSIKTMEELLSFYRVLNTLSMDSQKILEKFKDIISYSSKTDKIEWVSYIMPSTMTQIIKKDLEKRNKIQEYLTRFNVDLLKETLLETKLDTSLINRTITFMVVDLNIVPKEASEAEFDKEAYDRVFRWLFSVLTNMCYLALIKYCLKTGSKDKYVKFHIDKLKVRDVIYCKDTLTFCNVHLKNTSARKCFEMIPNSKEVENAVLNKDVKATQTTYILDCFKEYILVSKGL